MEFFLSNENTSIKRFVVTRPEAVAIILHNPFRNTLILIKQFRAPVFTKDQDPFVIEVPAGIIEKDEKPSVCAVREVFEETGYNIENPEYLRSFYTSPGILNEKVHLFYAKISDEDKKGKGGGLETENEFIELLEVSVDDALKMIQSGEIFDAKSIIAIFTLNQKNQSSLI
jgi:nudix-type nucleoside diphosphatase (YffH/AdpP family)